MKLPPLIALLPAYLPLLLYQLSLYRSCVRKRPTQESLSVKTEPITSDEAWQLEVGACWQALWSPSFKTQHIFPTTPKYRFRRAVLRLDIMDLRSRSSFNPQFPTAEASDQGGRSSAPVEGPGQHSTTSTTILTMRELNSGICSFDPHAPVFLGCGFILIRRFSQNYRSSRRKGHSSP